MKLFWCNSYVGSNYILLNFNALVSIEVQLESIEVQLDSIKSSWRVLKSSWIVLSPAGEY
jgi:hypothetical protein